MAESKEKKYLKTSDLIEQSGLTRQIIYEYISIGLIREAMRTEAGHRLFDDHSVTQARLIHELSNSGYPLRAIREIFVEGKGRKKADEARVPKSDT
jgi:MerR family copper efflux transcriptional regulator